MPTMSHAPPGRLSASLLLGGVKKSTIKQQLARDVELLPPADQFLPLASYSKKYGNPRSVENKKRKHKVCTINGVRGVAMPGSESDAPWTLQRHIRSSTLQEDEHDVDSDPELVAQKFKELFQEEEHVYADNVGGMIFDALKTCELNDEEAAEEDKRMKRRIAARNKSKKTKSASCKSIPVVSFGVHSDDGSDNDDEDLFGCEAAMSSRPQPKKAAKSGTQTVAGDPTSPTPTADKTPRNCSKNEQQVVAVGSPAASLLIADASAGALTKRGRPEKSIEVLTKQQRNLFAISKEGSLCFGDRTATSLRSIGRYIITASQRVLAATEQTRLGLELCKKELQVVEHGIKIYGRWIARKQVGPAVEEFLESWDALQSFCCSEPTVDLNCQFLSELFYQVVSCKADRRFYEQMYADAVLKTFPAMSRTEAKAFQKKCIVQAVVNVLSALDASAESVAKNLLNLLWPLVSLPHMSMFDNVELQAEILDLLVYTAGPANAERAKDYDAVVAKLPSREDLLGGEQCVAGQVSRH